MRRLGGGVVHCLDWNLRVYLLHVGRGLSYRTVDTSWREDKRLPDVHFGQMTRVH